MPCKTKLAAASQKCDGFLVRHSYGILGLKHHFTCMHSTHALMHDIAQ